MSKRRYVSTSFWDDGYIIEADPIEKLLFLYFLTNTLTNVAGIYEIAIKRISYDTGIDKEMVLKIIDRFSKVGKIFYIDGWIYIRNFQKHQNLENSKIKKGIDEIMKSIPIDIIKKIGVIDESYISHTGLSIYSDIDLDSDSDTKKSTSDKKIDTIPKKNFSLSLEEQRDGLTQENKDKYKSYKDKFFIHYTETNSKGKQKRQLEKTWSIVGRLTTWKDRADTNFGRNKPSNYETVEGFDKGMRTGERNKMVEILGEDKYREVKAKRKEDPLYLNSPWQGT